MSMTLGEKITAARKAKGLSQSQLGDEVGLAQNAISTIENNALKSPPDSRTLIRIADALGSIDILIHHCDVCPIRQHIMLKKYPDLNNIRTDPAVIAARLAKEMTEGAASLTRLMERFSDKDFKSRPDYMATFVEEFEQVVDVERGIEILKFELIRSGLHTQDDMRLVEDHQQEKCIKHGHHKVDAPISTQEV